MTLIKYGCIFVSSGVIISGALLWHAGGDKRVLGESVAEILAAQVERSQVAYLFGDELPDFSSNNVVSTRLEFDVIYGVLDGARSMTINNDAPVYWIDPAAAISYVTTLVSCDAQWSHGETNASGDYVCSMTRSNAVSELHTTGSRIAHPSIAYMPDVDTNDFSRIAKDFLGDVRLADAPLFGDNYNWWTAIGIDSNCYKYGCEEWHGLDPHNVTLAIEGSGFTLSTNLLHYPYNSYSLRSFEVASTSSSTNRLLAAVISTTLDDTWTTRTAVSDGAGALNLNIYLQSPTIELTEGGSIEFGIHPASNSGGVEFVRWVVIGSGVTADYSGSDYLYWGGANPSWSTTRNITVSALQDDDSLRAAAVIRFERSSQLGVYNYVAVSVADDESGAEIAAAPALLSLAKGATNSVAVSITITNAPTPYMYTDKRIVANNLMQARAVLTNLTRSIAFFAPASVAYESWIQTRYAAVTNAVVSGDTEVFDIYGFADALAAYNALDPELHSVITNTGAYSGDLIQANFNLDAENTKDTLFNFGESAYSASYDAITHRLTGCTLPYPSLYAITNGYVARVRIYLCVAPSLAGRTARPQYDSYEPLSYSGYSHQPWFYEGFGYGSGYALCSRNDGSAGLPANNFVKPEYGFVDGGFAVVNMSIVADVTAPTTNIVFALGSAPGAFDFSFSAKSDFEAYELLADEGGGSRYRVGYYDHNNLVRITHLLVVVDWGWQHLNDARPFEPIVNTPSWTIKE